MPAPVESKPLCPCPNCDKGRKLFGLALSQCGLFPARDANFMCRPMTEFMSRLAEALISTLKETRARDGVDLMNAEGGREVLYAVLLTPIMAHPGMLERITPLAEKLSALQVQAEAGTSRGVN